MKKKAIIILAIVLILVMTSVVYAATQGVFTKEEGENLIEEIKLVEGEKLEYVGEEEIDGTLWYEYEGDETFYYFNSTTGELGYAINYANQSISQEKISQKDALKDAKVYIQSLFSDMKPESFTLVRENERDRGGYSEYSFEWRLVIDEFDMDEGIFVTLNAGGELVSASAYRCKYQNKSLSEISIAVDENTAKDYAIKYLRDNSNEENVGDIKVNGIKKQMHLGEPCWAVDISLFSNGEVLFESPYILFVNMETGGISGY